MRLGIWAFSKERMPSLGGRYFRRKREGILSVSAGGTLKGKARYPGSISQGSGCYLFWREVVCVTQWFVP